MKRVILDGVDQLTVACAAGVAVTAGATATGAAGATCRLCRESYRITQIKPVILD